MRPEDIVTAAAAEHGHSVGHVNDHRIAVAVNAAGQEIFVHAGGGHSTDFDMFRTWSTFAIAALWFGCAFVRRRENQEWHAAVFVIMGLLIVATGYCDGGAGMQADISFTDTSFTCLPATSRTLSYLRTVWGNFCMLQLLLLCMGPGDPHVHALTVRSDNVYFFSVVQQPIDLNVILLTRVLPLAAAAASHYASWTVRHELMGSFVAFVNSVLWSLITLLVVNSVFWLRRTELVESVLLRAAYWRRLGDVSWRLLLLLGCLGALSIERVNPAMAVLLHAAMILLGESIIRHILSTEVAFVDCHANPTIYHVLMGSVAMLTVPALFIFAIADYAVSGAWRWPTVFSVSSSDWGCRLLAILAVLVYTSVCTVIWLLHRKVAVFPVAMDAIEVTHPKYAEVQHRIMCKRLSVSHGCLGVGFGAFSVLLQHGFAAQEILKIFCGMSSLVCFTLAMSFAALSSDTARPDHVARRNFTFLVCVPTALLCAACQVPQRLFLGPVFPSLVEYVTLVFLSMWPFVWHSELREVGERVDKAPIANAWPTTRWRFGVSESSLAGAAIGGSGVGGGHAS